MFGLFTFIAMTIACLGLFGLSSYLVVQRTKEIVIRKVLGSSVRQIVLLVSGEFTFVILLSALIAWPVSFFVAKNWLNGFAYHMELSLLIFIVPAMGVFLISILTVAGQSIKAANADPVKNLRTE